MTQKNSKPTVTSLLLNLESVSSAVAGAVLLGNRMGGLEYFGCMLMLAVVIFAQLARELNISDLRKCVAGFQVHPVPEGVKLKKAHSTLR